MYCKRSKISTTTILAKSLKSFYTVTSYSTVQLQVSVAQLAMHKKIFITTHVSPLTWPEFYVEPLHAMQIIGVDIILGGRGRAKSALPLSSSPWVLRNGKN